MGMVYPFDYELEKPIYSQLVPCTAPGCQAEQLHELALQQGFDERRGIAPLQTLDSFEPVQGAIKCLEAAKALANGTAPPFLLIFGDLGNGKTHLANAVALKLSHAGHKSRCRTMADILEWLHEGIDKNNLAERVRELGELDVLVIDDFEAKRCEGEKGAWAKEKLEQIIDHRYRAMRITMVTTNDQDTELPARIYDRFQDKEIAVVRWNKADNYRPQKKRKRSKKDDNDTT